MSVESPVHGRPLNHFLALNSFFIPAQIRKQLAKEWASDLMGVPEENASLLRESLTSSLDKMFAGYTSSGSDDDGKGA